MMHHLKPSPAEPEEQYTARRTVSNDSSSYSWVRSGPGKQYDEQYKVYNGETVYTTGYHEYSGGYDWYELDDGNFIAGSLIGY